MRIQTLNLSVLYETPHTCHQLCKICFGLLTLERQHDDDDDDDEAQVRVRGSGEGQKLR